jgi:hypothetical protein
MSDAADNAKPTGQSAADTTGAAASQDTAAPSVDAARLATLEAAAAKLAKIEAAQAAAAQAEAVKRGEYDAVIAKLTAEAEAVKATAARQAEDLALVGIHAGLTSAEAREVARTLYGLVPEGKRAASLAEQVKAWAKKPDEAPVALRGYLGAAAQPVSVGGAASRGAANSDGMSDDRLRALASRLSYDLSRPGSFESFKAMYPRIKDSASVKAALSNL